MRDVQEQLRSFSQSMVESLPDLEPGMVMDPVVGGPTRTATKTWRPWAAIAGLAVVAVVAVPLILSPDQPPTVTTPVVPPTTTIPTPTTLPVPDRSQSEADALRDGVPTEVAAIPLEHRVVRLSELQAEEGIWVLSEVSRDFVREDPDLFHLVEYGEVLLLDSDGAILRAFPMEYAPPTWMTIEEGYLYAGRTGDGGLPHSTLVRIDRSILDWVVVMIPSGHDAEGGDDEWPPTWHTWPDNWFFGSEDDVDAYSQVVGFASQGMTGTPVTSWVGEVVVDLPGVGSLLDEVIGAQQAVSGSLYTYLNCSGGDWGIRVLNIATDSDGNLFGVGVDEARTPETAINDVTRHDPAEMTRLAETADVVILGLVEANGLVPVVVRAERFGIHWALRDGASCSEGDLLGGP